MVSAIRASTILNYKGEKHYERRRVLGFVFVSIPPPFDLCVVVDTTERIEVRKANGQKQ